jgi:hypothetical protein
MDDFAELAGPNAHAGFKDDAEIDLPAPRPASPWVDQNELTTAGGT